MITGFRDTLLKMGKAYDYVMADIWLRDFSNTEDLLPSGLYLLLPLRHDGALRPQRRQGCGVSGGRQGCGQ